MLFRSNMPNQYSHSRNWKRETAETCVRLCVCVVLPEKWIASSKITSYCLHGNKSETSLFKFIQRQYCCKSAACKAHDPEQKRRAAIKSWEGDNSARLSSFRRRFARPEEKRRLSEALKGVSNSWRPGPHNENLPAVLALIVYRDSSGVHLKVGITHRSLKERYRKQIGRAHV